MVEIESPEVRVLRNGDYLAIDEYGILSVRGEDKFDVVEEFYEKFDDLGHGEYRFAVPHAGGDTVILYDDSDPFIILSDEGASILFDGDDESSTFENHSPTEDFWDTIMYANSYTSRLAEYYNHADAYGDDVANAFDTNQANLPRSRVLPEYESRIVFEFASRLLRNRTERLNAYDDFPRMKKFLREAHIQTKEDVPEYLRVME